MKITIQALLLALACAAGAAQAQDKKASPQAQDKKAAPQAAAGASQPNVAMCVGCHGIPGYKTAYPEVYHVPKIAGQQAAYIENALKAYRAGQRPHPSMRGIAGGMTDEQIAAYAKYYAGDAVKPAGSAQAKNQAAQVCAACHGPDGATPSAAENPVLAGQYADYLLKSLKEYKSGKRSNPIMQGFAAQLSTKDMEGLAAYFASQKSVLHDQR